MDPQLIPPPNHHFLYKAIFLSISLLLLPFFSSRDFMINTTTASWGELLQLVFVGIAVSYGLFSTKRKHEKQADAQSCDDFEIETPFPSKDNNTTKVWNSQYYRGEPIVVVANKEPSSSSSVSSRLVSTSNSTRLLTPEEEEEDGVLRSPIPWRSRSARNMEVNPPSALLETRSKSFQHFGSSSKKTTFPPTPPPPPPLPLNRISTKQFTRNYDLHNSKGTIRGTSLSSFRTPNQTQQQQDGDGDNYLSHDQEIESFIETRGGGKFIIDKQKFIPNPKQDDKKKKEITDTEESSTEDEDDELRELASKTSNGNVNGSGGEIVGPDIDKKAEEFIAKFREQIRLKRIASIRTSTQK